MRKRRQQKLILEEPEIALIKGLIAHTDLNDQMIVAIFSHASRTINHREIGYFRDLNNEKYQAYAASSKSHVEAFLARYGRFERVAKQLGFLPQEANFQLVQKSAEAMKSAVATFNNPNIKWKSEIFIVNAVISWTYLMHAYYQAKRVDYRYKKNGELILTDERRPKHWELTKCLNAHECPLPNPVKANLKYLIAVRNEIEHRLSDNVDSFLEPKLQACALNFNYWMCEWFGEECSIAPELAFAIQFAEISLRSNPAIVGDKGLPDVIQTVNDLIEGDMSEDDYNDPQYSYRVFVVPKTINNPKKADQAVTYASPGSAIETAVREVERPKFTASQIVAQMKDEGFADFSLYGKGGFVEVWQGLDGKNPALGFGVHIAGLWYWYDKMVGEVRAILTQRGAEA
ncbi:MAG: DUF3644 domain-containing protein [Pseudomonadota bacterium]